MVNTSSDPQRFFETDASISLRERRQAKSGNKYGNPITLKSKIVAAVLDPGSPSCIFIAESAGSVRRVNIDGGDSKTVYRGPTAPVTCVAVGGPADKTLFAGSWDKAVWSWDIDTKAAGRKFLGHTDFVKAVVCTRIGGKDVLISGGADRKILVWDAGTGARLHTLQDSVQEMLAVQSLAIDPVQTTAEEAYLVSATSDPHIRRWKIRLDAWEQVVETSPAERRTILEHQTTVYKLVFDGEGEEVDLWTASADGTAKCLSRLNDFRSDDSLAHRGHVRAVAVTDAWVITAGRDELIKFWDRATGRLYAALEGHYDEVTDLAVIKKPGGQGDRLCSVSIDGTVRSWALAKAALDALVKEQKEAANGADQAEMGSQTGKAMTADEEDELAALMGDD